MNNKNDNDLGEVIRRAVQFGVDFLNNLNNKISKSGRSDSYYDPNIVDMPQPPAVYEEKPGNKVLGTIMAVAGFGWAGITVLWSSFLLLGAAIVGEIGFGLGIFIFNMFIAGGCGFLGYKGTKMLTSINRFKTYVKTIGEEELCNIKQLAARIGKSERFVVKDVERMIQKGWFCQGHLDEKKTCLMVTDHMYQEYRKLEQERKQHQIEEEERRRRAQIEEEERCMAEEAKQKAEEEEAMRWERSKNVKPLWGGSKSENNGAGAENGGLKGSSAVGKTKATGGFYSVGNKKGNKSNKNTQRNPNLSPEVQKIIDQGDEYAQKIRECNDAIPGEVISAKIDHMEVLVDKIFDRIEQKPEMVGDIRKLMEYYLPTTIKLLETYAEMDAQPVGGANIQAAKQEIEESLDTINTGFEKLLDSLFQDTAWDVSSDISVLKMMLAQEGLKDDGLKK